MKVEDFFDEVYYGHLPDIDIYNTLEKLTDGYDEIKLNLLCKDFDFYCFMKQEEFLGSFSHEEIEKKMHEIENEGKKIPVVSDKNRSPLSVSAYFKLPEHKKIKKEEDWTDEGIKRLDKFFSDMRENQKITLDVEKLMDPHGVEFLSLHRLKNLLVDLKRKHTESIYKFEDETNDSFNPFQKNFKSEKSETFKFFESVSAGELSKLDIQNRVQRLTDNYDSDKLKTLCSEFDEYIFVKYENWRASYSESYFKKKISKLKSDQIPIRGDNRNKHYLPFVKDFFLKTRFGKPISDAEFEKHMDEIFGAERSNSDVIDDNVLLGGFYYATQSRSLRDLRDILIKLKRKHTDAVYRFDDKEPQVNNIQPIHWLAGEESLRLFLQSIKKAELIDNRETNNIIQEHFYVDGKKPTNKNSQPINWLKSKVLLAYLIEELSTKPNMNEPFIEPDKKWQLTELHFTVKGKGIGRSLVNDIKQSRYPNGCEEIDSILKSLTKY